MALRKRTNAYWEKRSVERLTAAERASNTHLKQIYKVYDEARRKTVQDIKSLYTNYYKGDEGFDMKALRSIAPSGDIARFHAKMKALGLETHLPDAYGGRMTRLELMNAQMWAEMKNVGIKQNMIQTNSHVATINNGYYRTIYDTAKGIGATPAFSKLNTRTVNTILNSRFEGSNYSSRIWNNTDLLAKQVQEKLSVAIASGQSQAKTVREIQERFGVGKYYAKRLVQTETNYFENKTEIESYDSMGIESFVFLATLDGRTSRVCQDHDGKIVKVKDAVQGLNAPPLHPNCRSTTRPYLGRELEPRMRIARDPRTGENEYVANMSYKQWVSNYASDAVAVPKAGIQGAIVTLSTGIRYNSVATAHLDRTLFDNSIMQFNNVLAEYPSIQKSIKEHGGLEIKAGNISAKAGTAQDSSKIVLSNKWFKDKKKYIDALENEIAVGFKMKVPKREYYIYTATHEMGHIVENHLMGKRVSDTRLATSIKNDIIGIAMNISGKPKNELLSQMSGYGRTKPREFFAEAFTSYKLGGKDVWAKAMGEYLKARLK